jgi:hypothetical protein
VTLSYDSVNVVDHRHGQGMTTRVELTDEHPVAGVGGAFTNCHMWALYRLVTHR